MKGLKDEAGRWELKASNIQDQLAQIRLDYQVDQKRKEVVMEEQKVSIEKLNTKVENLETDKKRSEEHHSQQIAEKQQALEQSQKEKITLAET